MKREFKKGDRVLVRNHDLEEWQEAIFESLAERKEQSHPFIQFCPFIVKLLEGGEFWYKQCRHIDDFRTGDKVQVRSSMTEEWEDAIYGCYVPHDSFEHWVYSEDEDDLMSHKLCRWHPSMPWAEKEEPPVFERGDYIERINFYKKMYDDFGEVALIAFPTHRDDLSEAVAAAKECWPNARVTGFVVAFQDGSSGVEVLFNQVHKDND